jgi:hypothetical protein
VVEAGLRGAPAVRLLAVARQGNQDSFAVGGEARSRRATS